MEELNKPSLKRHSATLVTDSIEACPKPPSQNNSERRASRRPKGAVFAVKKLIREYAIVTADLLYQAAESLAKVQGYQEVQLKPELTDDHYVHMPNEEETDDLWPMILIKAYGYNPKSRQWERLDLDESDLFCQCYLELMNFPHSIEPEFWVYDDNLYPYSNQVLPRSADLDVGILLLKEETKED